MFARMTMPDSLEQFRTYFFDVTGSEVKKNVKSVDISITRGFTPEQWQAEVNTKFFTRKFSFNNIFHILINSSFVIFFC